MIPARGFHYTECRHSIVRCFERGESLDQIARRISHLRPGADVVRRGIEEQIRTALMERGRNRAA